jgi:hypothetical protein
MRAAMSARRQGKREREREEEEEEEETPMEGCVNYQIRSDQNPKIPTNVWEDNAQMTG